MEPLIITATGVWRHIEILQWMERNTMVFREAFGGLLTPPHAYAAPLNSCYQSKQKINELLGIKEVLR